jgi:hypothetical protein
MPPFGFDEDEWLAAQFLLFFDETGDVEEARRRTEVLRAQRAAQRSGGLPPTRPVVPPTTPPAKPMPQPSANRGCLGAFWAWVRR